MGSVDIIINLSKHRLKKAFSSGRRWHGNAVTDEVSVTNKKIHYLVRVRVILVAKGMPAGHRKVSS